MKQKFLSMSMGEHLEIKRGLSTKEIIRLKLDAENANKVREEAKAVLESMTQQRGMTRE